MKRAALKQAAGLAAKHELANKEAERAAKNQKCRETRERVMLAKPIQPPRATPLGIGGGENRGKERSLGGALGVAPLVRFTNSQEIM